MSGEPNTSPATGTLLLSVASELEARAVLGDRPAPALWTVAPITGRASIVITGIGKANAAAAATRAISESRPTAIVSFGIAGSLPTANAPAIGDAVLSTASVFADEGILTPAGFQTCREMGFPLAPAASDSFEPDAELERSMPGSASVRRGAIATVSTCSGTAAAAAAVAARTGAIAEAMEGAAVGLACARLAVPFAELRVISNTTGDRDAQRWDIERAIKTLSELARSITTTSPPA